MATDELDDALDNLIGLPDAYHVTEWLRSPEGRAVVARALGEDALVSSIARGAQLVYVYPDGWVKFVAHISGSDWRQLTAERTGDGDEQD